MVYSNKSINQFIDHLIDYEAVKNSEGHYILYFEDLCIDDQGHLVSLFLDRDDRDIFSIYENDEFEIIVGRLINYLDVESNERAIELSQSLKRNVIKYYSQQAQELIDERCSYKRSDELFEHGYKECPYRGEIVRC